MPKRNLAWMLVVIIIALLFWQLPDTVARRDSVYRVFGPLVDIRAEIHKGYVEEVSDKELLRGAIHGMLLWLDPYSAYFDEDEYPEFRKRTSGIFGGIGI